MLFEQIASVIFCAVASGKLGPLLDQTGVYQTIAEEEEGKCVMLYRTVRARRLCVFVYTCSLYPETWPVFSFTPRPQKLRNSEMWWRARQRDEWHVVAWVQHLPCTKWFKAICIPEGHTVPTRAMCLHFTTDSKMSVFCWFKAAQIQISLSAKITDRVTVGKLMVSITWIWQRKSDERYKGLSKQGVNTPHHHG